MTGPKLDTDAVNAGIAGSPWELKDGGLERVIRWKNFVEALAYVNRVGEVAEAAGHHPDIGIVWNTVTLRLSTHDAGGITAADLDMAQRIDALDG
jgi:4a-hydroxytetrahydrobiopterin dehydratase